MKAVISVIGKDAVGILAKVFAMVMLVDITKLSIPLSELSDRMSAMGKEMGLSIYVMHEDIFNTMHHI